MYILVLSTFMTYLCVCVAILLSTKQSVVGKYANLVIWRRFFFICTLNDQDSVQTE